MLELSIATKSNRAPTKNNDLVNKRINVLLQARASLPSYRFMVAMSSRSIPSPSSTSCSTLFTSGT